MANAKLEFLVAGKLKETGTPFTCSRFTARQLSWHVRHADSYKSKLVVEFGAGTGAVTREILKQLRISTRLIAFEINDEFCEMLREIPDTRLKVVNDSAANFTKYMDEEPYCIISVLPISLPSFSEKFKLNLFRDSRDSLEKFGRFVQFQYWPFPIGGSNYELMKRFFEHTFKENSWRNILPPGKIYGGVKT